MKKILSILIVLMLFAITSISVAAEYIIVEDGVEYVCDKDGNCEPRPNELTLPAEENSLEEHKLLVSGIAIVAVITGAIFKLKFDKK